ncbi:MAG: glycosyltransferase family 4 protein [Methanosarcinales archaeon]|nr:glycosyltransferase family 4 protein [Methanosarcinales archaeon]HUV02023.1 glycosyltransferase family 4 protein [Desulfobacteria bacterium]
MKIGFFVSEYPPRVVSGLGMYAENICHAMKNVGGHDISVFTMNDGTLKTRETLNGIDVHRPLLVNGSSVLPQVLTMQNLLRLSTENKFFNDVLIYNILSAAKFANEFVKKEKEPFDLICAHNWLSAIAGVIVKEETGLPFVFHLHSIEGDRSAIRDTTIIRHIEETAAQAADRVITVCHPLHEYLIMHGFDARKLHVCWNAIDVAKYDPGKVDTGTITAVRMRYGIERKEKMLLFVGDLAHERDIINLLEATQMVVRKHPEAKLVILGRGELERKVSSRIKDLKIEANVQTRFEVVTEEERIIHYGASDAVVCPSLYGPCSIISLEAMAMRKPIIVGAKSICCTCEYMVPSGSGQTGVLADGSIPVNFAWEMCRLLEDVEGAKAMGERGRISIERYSNWDKIAACTLGIYNEVVKEVGARPT